MMKHSKMAKKSLSALLALVMLLSCFSGITLTASAAGETITVGELVANNYDLTAAEKALLSSGNLAGGSVNYTVPTDSDNLVTIDTENNKIIAESKYDFVPVSAVLLVAGEEEEEITLTNGEGAYTYDGNAFSVVVTYELHRAIDGEIQEQLLNTAEWLQHGLENLEVAHNATDANLGTVVLAMDVLSQLAAGIDLGWASAKFGAEAILAVEALKAEITANGDKLNLQIVNEAYNASQSKTEYLLKNGAGYQEVMTATYGYLKAISADGLLNNSILDSYLQSQMPAEYTAWMALKSILANMVGDLEPVTTADWTAAEYGTALVSDGVNYSALDTLVAALGAITPAPAVKNPLSVATTTIQTNASMFNVTVEVILNTVQNNNEITQYGEPVTTVLTLAENATDAEILTAVDENGIVANAISKWGAAYVGEKYIETTSVLPTTLTGDITYTITYFPKTFNVRYSYAETEQLPYGYVITLPVHADPASAYDYKVNGTKYAQGSVITITEDTIIDQTVGKAYTPGDLLTIIANNYGNDTIDSILKSGALIGNEAVNIRYPDALDTSELLELKDGTLTAKPTYDSSYENLNWTPYSYGPSTGDEYVFAGNTASYDGASAVVKYSLELTNFDEVTVVKYWLELAKTLYTEATAQKSALDALLGHKGSMNQLDKTKLGALNGVIDVTDLHTDPAKNDELKAYFKGIVSSIIGECLTGNELTLSVMLGEYGTNGLRYYYENSESFQAELNKLTGYLNEMLADDDEKVAALTTLCGAAGYPEYAEKISDLGGNLDELNRRLSAPNAVIDVESDKLGTLIGALTSATAADYNDEYGTLKVYSDKLTVTGNSNRLVQIFVDGNVAASLVIGSDDTFTQLNYEYLMAESAEERGIYADYYNESVDKDLSVYIGSKLDGNVNINYTYTAKEYTVTINGEEHTIITVENLEISLPKYNGTGFKYKYLIDGVETEVENYTFTREQLSRLFVGGTYDIQRNTIDLVSEDLEDMADGINESLGAGTVELVKDGDVYSEMIVNISSDDMMGFVMELTSYSYVGFNGEGLLYMDESDTTKLSLQTILNVIMSDEDLIQNIIDSESMNVDTTIQLGDTVDDAHSMAFTLNLKNLPETLVDAVKGMMEYVNIKGNPNESKFDVELTLDDQIYGAYLTALAATGYAEKKDLRAVEQDVVSEFMKDYLIAFIESGADLTSIDNTITKLGQNVGLSAYNDYYSYVDTVVLKNSLDVDANDGSLNLTIPAKGNKVVKTLLDAMGVEVDETILSMVKENQPGEYININAALTVANVGKDYLAIIVDAEADGIKNKFDAFTEKDKLDTKLSNLGGYSAVLLLNDVTGDLTVAGDTTIDLNGKTITGNITSTGKLIIVDSTIGNDGVVDGELSGTVKVAGGTYTYDLENGDFLEEGYKVEAGVVTNELYSITGDENNIVVTFNSDFETKPDKNAALVMAADVAADVLLNFFDTASLNIGGNDIYNVDFAGVVDWYNGTGRMDDIINRVVEGMIDYDNVKNFVNDLSNKLCAFDDVVSNDGKIAEYEVTTEPWMIVLKNAGEAGSEYLELGIMANADKNDVKNITFKVDGETATELYGQLSDIATVTATVSDLGVTYDNKAFDVAVGAAVEVEIDLIAEGEEYNEAYLTVIALALDNAGQPELLDAISAEAELFEKKAIFDSVTMADIIDALVALNWGDSFADMAASKLDTAIDLEVLNTAYMKLSIAAGYVLNYLAIDGPATEVGAFDNVNAGTYVYNNDNIAREISRTKSGYTVNIGATLSVDVTIEMFDVKKLEDNVTVSVAGKTYDGQPAELTITKNSTGEVTVYYYTNAECTEGETTEAPVNVGTYWVVVEVAEDANYESAKIKLEEGFTISPRPIYIKRVTTDGREYDGTKVVEISEVIFDNVVDGDDVGYTVVRADMVDANAGIGKNVTVEVTISNTNYYLENAINNDATVDIAKAHRDNQTDEQSVKYGNSITINSVYNADNETAIIYGIEDESGIIDGTPLIENETLSVTIKNDASLDGKSVKIVVLVRENLNYADYFVEYTINVTSKAPQTITAADVTVTYGETGKRVEATNETTGGGAITYGVKSGGDVVAVNAMNGELTIKKAGTAVITVTAAETTTYAADTKTITVIVNPKAITVEAKDQIIKVNDTVPDLRAPVAGTHYTVTGLVGSDELTTITMVYQLDGSATTPDNTKTGTYDIVITAVDAGANYTVTTTDAKLTISRRSTGGGGSSNNAYSIVVLSAENGTVTANKTKATKNETVTLMAKADQGYMLESLTVTTSSGSNVALTERGGGKYTFTMPASKVTVKATFVKRAAGTTSFTDISPDDYFYDAVLWAVEMGITDGTSATTFSPELGCTRAQMVTFLWRAAGMPEATITETPFVDVDEYSYYYEALLWAYEVGVTDGTSETTFSPDEICSRGQMAAFMYRYDGKPAISGDHPFDDVVESDYYHNAVVWAFSEGITDGTSETTFSPKNVCTRGQMVTFLYRFLGE